MKNTRQTLSFVGQTLSFGYMEKNILPDWDKYQKGVFYPGFLIRGSEEKPENFKNKMDDQKVKTLVLTVAT